MEIVIEGWRAGAEDRKTAARVPGDRLPQLSEAQRAVAKKMGISEEAYARSAYAGKLNQERLLEKTRRFGEILEEKLQAKAEGARVERIRLVTIEHEYRIELSVNGKKVLFRLPEEMVDDFVEGGSAEVGRLIERNLETLLAAQVA